MKSGRNDSVGLGAIAKAAGVTRATVSYALNCKPGVSRATRERILKIAKEMGYTTDARVASWMATVRDSKSRDLLPIAWLNHHSLEEDAWHAHRFLTPYLEGAQERARELGYRLEEIWTKQPGMTTQRLSNILYRRGIEGVVVTQFGTRLQLDWRHFAGVALEYHHVAPALPRVETDINHNLFLAFKMVKKLGYRRIGFCFDESWRTNKPALFDFWPAVCYLNASMRSSDRVPPLIYRWYQVNERLKGGKQVVDWIRRYRPEVIICYSNQMVEWAENAGFKVPEEIGVVHLATDDDVPDWAGICSNRRVVAATAMDWIVAKIMKRNFGLEPFPPRMMIHGFWHPGKTLLPNPNVSPAK